MPPRIRYIRAIEPGIGIVWADDDSDASNASTPARIASMTGHGKPRSSAFQRHQAQQISAAEPGHPVERHAATIATLCQANLNATAADCCEFWLEETRRPCYEQTSFVLVRPSGETLGFSCAEQLPAWADLIRGKYLALGLAAWRAQGSGYRGWMLGQ